MLENLKPPVKILPCKIRAILENMEDDDQDILMGALLDMDTWKDHVLTEELNKLGVAVSANSIRKHRRRQCSCKALN